MNSTEIKTVYLITENYDYEGSEPVAVFSKEQLASDYIKEFGKSIKNPTICPMVLDEEAGAKCVRCWSCSITKDHQLVNYYSSKGYLASNRIFNGADHIINTESEWISVTSLVSQADARKIAKEVHKKLHPNAKLIV